MADSPESPVPESRDMLLPIKKSTWLVPLAIACLVAVFGWWGTGRLRQTMEGQLKGELISTLEANVTALDIWMGNEGRLATALADEPATRDLALKVLQRAEVSAVENRRAPVPADVEELTALLRPRLAKLGYQLANLVSTNYLMLATPQRGPMRGWMAVYDEHLDKFSELFASGKPVIITPFRPKRPRFEGSRNSARPPRGQERGQDPPRPPELPFPLAGDRPPGGPSPGGGPPPGGRSRFGDGTLMQVAAPIRDEQGVVRGALALIINPEAEFTRILSVARSGDSGETYALDQHGMILSRSRFDDQLRALGLIDKRAGSSSALNLRLSDPGTDFPTAIPRESPTNSVRALTQIAANAIAGSNGVDVVASRDYRGVPVIGAWRWLPQHGFGVATQVDASEAYRPLRVLKLLFVILFLLLLLCTVGLFLFSYLNLLWRRRVNEAELRVRQLGQYRLEEKIGEGGMGTVYRARHSLMRRETAVKLLLPNRADPEAEHRFEREVCLTCQLTHPNTIQVYDYGHTPEGIFYYAMELLHGLNLDQLVERHGPQPECRVIHILQQVCDSLAEAHALGLIHRDIKPANVFLCERGGMADCVKVLDFGLVREYRSIHGSPLPGTPERGRLGTPLFMPPESIQDASQSDPRSDIYSLGALAYHLLTAHHVFNGRTVAELWDQHRNEPPRPPSERTTNPISPQLEGALMRCLEKDPSLRPQSASELRELLLTSPRASEWTLQARSEWWRNNPQSIPAVRERSRTTERPVDATVKIDFSDRTPPPSTVG